MIMMETQLYWTKKNKIWKKVKPKKYKGVCFPYRYHYQFYPKSGIRAVAVYTFI